MRVLHVSSGNLYGGVETALVALARFRNLCPAMQPEFALCFEGRLSKELANASPRKPKVMICARSWAAVILLVA